MTLFQTRRRAAVAALVVTIAVAGCGSASPTPSPNRSATAATAAPTGSAAPTAPAATATPAQVTAPPSSPSSASGNPSPTDPGPSFEDPSPSIAPHLAPDLEALIPSTIRGVTLAKESTTGEILTAEGTGAEIAAYLTTQGKTPADLQIAQAYDPALGLDLYVLAFGGRGIDMAGLKEILVGIGALAGEDVTATPVTIAGRSVTHLTDAAGLSTWIYQSPANLFVIETVDEGMATEVLQALP